MIPKIAIYLVLTLSAAASVAAESSFLHMERLLQTAGTNLTTACTSDMSCSATQCCADYARLNGTTRTNVTKVCLATSLSGQRVLFGGLNHTFNCTNTTRITTQVACNASSACSATNNSCCLEKSFAIFGVNQTMSNVCGVASGLTSQGYNLTSFSTVVSLYDQCLPVPTPTPTPPETPAEPPAPTPSTPTPSNSAPSTPNTTSPTPSTTPGSATNTSTFSQSHSTLLKVCGLALVSAFAVSTSSLF